MFNSQLQCHMEQVSNDNHEEEAEFGHVKCDDDSSTFLSGNTANTLNHNKVTTAEQQEITVKRFKAAILCVDLREMLILFGSGLFTYKFFISSHLRSEIIFTQTFLSSIILFLISHSLACLALAIGQIIFKTAKRKINEFQHLNIRADSDIRLKQELLQQEIYTCRLKLSTMLGSVGAPLLQVQIPSQNLFKELHADRSNYKNDGAITEILKILEKFTQSNVKLLHLIDQVIYNLTIASSLQLGLGVTRSPSIERIERAMVGRCLRRREKDSSILKNYNVAAKFRCPLALSKLRKNARRALERQRNVLDLLCHTCSNEDPSSIDSFSDTTLLNELTVTLLRAASTSNCSLLSETIDSLLISQYSSILLVTLERATTEINIALAHVESGLFFFSDSSRLSNDLHHSIFEEDDPSCSLLSSASYLTLSDQLQSVQVALFALVETSFKPTEHDQQKLLYRSKNNFFDCQDESLLWLTKVCDLSLSFHEQAKKIRNSFLNRVDSVKLDSLDCASDAEEQPHNSGTQLAHTAPKNEEHLEFDSRPHRPSHCSPEHDAADNNLAQKSVVVYSGSGSLAHHCNSLVGAPSCNMQPSFGNRFSLEQDLMRELQTYLMTIPRYEEIDAVSTSFKHNEEVDEEDKAEILQTSLEKSSLEPIRFAAASLVVQELQKSLLLISNGDDGVYRHEQN